MGSKLKVGNSSSPSCASATAAAHNNSSHKEMEGLEQDLTCSMCFEFFRNPKALPCLHTFCQECLQIYINSQASIIAQTGKFNCPLCRNSTRPPEPVDRNINAWASGFANNHLIASMIENLKAHKTKDGFSIFQKDRKDCSNCIKNGAGCRGGGGRVGDPQNLSSLLPPPVLCSKCKKYIGSRWCEQCCQNLCGYCEKIHSKNTETKMHVVVDAPLKAHRSASLPFGTVFDQVNNRQCTKHPGNLDSYYCVKCSVACCSECVADYHASCYQILPLQQAVQNKVQLGQVYTSIIGLQKDNLKHLQSVVTSKIHDNRTNHERLCREILSIRPMVDKILAEDERRLVDQLATRTKSVTADLNEMQATCKKSIDGLVAKGEVLKSVLDMNTVERFHFLSIWDDISDFMKKNSSHHQDIKTQLENLHMSSLSFEQSSLVRSILKGTDSSIGSLVSRRASSKSGGGGGGGGGGGAVAEDACSAGNTEIPAGNSCKFKLKSSRNLKLDSEGQPLLTDICLLPGDVVVMTDFNNNKVKMFDQQRELKYCILPTSPYGVTYKPDTDQIIISLPGSKEIAYISSSLKIERHVKLLREYSAVVFDRRNRTLLCTSTNPGSIDILFEDVVVRSLGLADIRRPLFAEPEYLAVYSKQNILVSDWKKKTLFCVDSKGNVISTFIGDLGVNELRCPLGVAVDNSSRKIYLADKETCKIFRFSADLKFECIVLSHADHVKQPMAIAFDSKGHLFVTESSGYLKVFG